MLKRHRLGVGNGKLIEYEDGTVGFAVSRRASLLSCTGLAGAVVRDPAPARMTDLGLPRLIRLPLRRLSHLLRDVYLRRLDKTG